MKWILALLTAGMLWAAPKVGRVTVVALEKNFDRILERDVMEGNPFLLLGMTRGVYLQGVGAVYSAEVNLAVGPALSPFRQEITKDDISRLRQRKLERLPALRRAMRQMMFDAAARLDGVGPEEEVVVAVSLFQHHWEDQIVRLRLL